MSLKQNRAMGLILGIKSHLNAKNEHQDRKPPIQSTDAINYKIEDDAGL